MKRHTHLVKFIFVLFIAFSMNDNLISQKLITNKIALDYEVIDTIGIDESLRDIRVIWLSDTIVINKRNDNYTVDTTIYKSESFLEFMDASAQNCYSYALEKYFENDSIYSQDLFNRNVTIGGQDLHTIIENHFHLIHEFSVKERKMFMKQLTDNSIIGLVDKKDRIIHLVFFKHGVFHTKNGLFPASEFTNIRKFVRDTYPQTAQLHIYKFSDSKTNSQQMLL